MVQISSEPMNPLLRKGLSAINAGLRPVGFELSRIGPNSADPFRDIDSLGRSIYEAVKPFTVTGPAAVFTLCDAVRYVVRAKIPGAFVECGVFMGGSSMAAALAAKQLGADLDIHLFDTFEGMPPPTERDAFVLANRPVLGFDPKTGDPWTRCDEATVRANMARTGYNQSRLHFHRGMVEATIPEQAPSQISVLRLDTDWYESTKHELVHLWPRLSPGGILIIDDYGEFTGARDAVDEYFAPRPVFLFRVDYSRRMVVKDRSDSSMS
jgi:O-methyltransferase